MKKLILIFIAFTFLISCDCHQVVKGIIIDSETKKPIEHVEVYNKNKRWNNTITDENGFFELTNISGGFTCPPMKIIIRHENYDKVETEIDAGKQKNLLLVRRKFE